MAGKEQASLSAEQDCMDIFLSDDFALPILMQFNLCLNFPVASVSGAQNTRHQLLVITHLLLTADLHQLVHIFLKNPLPYAVLQRVQCARLAPHFR